VCVLVFLSWRRIFSESVRQVNENKIKIFVARSSIDGECLIMSDHRKIDTRMSKRLFELVDGYAAAQGIKRSAVVVQALEQFFGMQKQTVSPTDFARTRNILPTPLFHAPVSRVHLNDEKTTVDPHGASIHDPSDKSDGGSKTAKTPIRYQAKRRKSSS
jgi:hypothetical protein